MDCYTTQEHTWDELPDGDVDFRRHLLCDKDAPVDGAWTISGDWGDTYVNQLFFEVSDENGVRHRYECPQWVLAFLTWAMEAGRKDVRRRIMHALGATRCP